MASIAISGIIFARWPAMAAFIIMMTGWIPGKGGTEGAVK
jgi:hypothetical protein